MQPLGALVDVEVTVAVGWSWSVSAAPDPGTEAKIQVAEDAVLVLVTADTVYLVFSVNRSGDYARWMLDTPGRSSGLEPHVATEGIAWKDLAAASIAVMGLESVYKDVTLDEYFKFGLFPNSEAKIRHSVNHDDPTLFTVRENYSGFWYTWKGELTKSDYKLLDEICQQE
ncbi:hypothetical protein V495_00142 [Pseudogymnoascus sp. VKM F-4514 (FW-929)]|nr:hypothetical protein V495_00142 [Pseudogymnoascus sp. VKM F-4514 (FW-929)]KFY67466.1 hypothetical protein V497_00368 [Pseudogymnoascus sp. VKM F-4516 (FW-969)]